MFKFLSLNFNSNHCELRSSNSMSLDSTLLIIDEVKRVDLSHQICWRSLGGSNLCYHKKSNLIQMNLIKHQVIQWKFPENVFPDSFEFLPIIEDLPGKYSQSTFWSHNLSEKSLREFAVLSNMWSSSRCLIFKRTSKYFKWSSRMCSQLELLACLLHYFMAIMRGFRPDFHQNSSTFLWTSLETICEVNKCLSS